MESHKIEDRGVERTAYSFSCPACGTTLQALSTEEKVCPVDGSVYRRLEGIWRFLLPERQEYFSQFTQEYETVRRAEGRGSIDPAYYRALPFEDLTGRMSADWCVRACSYAALVEQVIRPLERKGRQPLKILDMGAGNGWLSYRLSERGHQVAAIDLLTNTWDGLGVCRFYETALTLVNAEFEHLPFPQGEADMVIFNASLHYASDYLNVLREGLRVLNGNGLVVLLDSPIYHLASSGEQMVKERQALYTQLYGFPSNALNSQNYLTDGMLGEMASRLGLRWHTISPFYGIRWALKPWLARLRRQREPARFLIIVGERATQTNG